MCVAAGASALPAGFSPSAHGGRWPYRYHPMFRALLLAELMRSSPEELRRLSALAAAWFSKQGEHIRAAPLAVQGQSWEALGEAVLAGSCVALATEGLDLGPGRNSPDCRIPPGRRSRHAAVIGLDRTSTGARMEAMASLARILDGRPRPRTRQQWTSTPFCRPGGSPSEVSQGGGTNPRGRSSPRFDVLRRDCVHSIEVKWRRCTQHAFSSKAIRHSGDNAQPVQCLQVS